jgi:hypothetical protein
MSSEKIIITCISISVILSILSPMITGNPLSDEKAEIIKVVVITMLAKVPFDKNK